MNAPDADGLLGEQLLRLTRRVHRIQKRHLEKCGLGITPAQSRLLRVLAQYPSPPSMADLARHLEVVPRAVTTLVDGLEASGAVRRAPDSGNRRVIRIELTDGGRRALKELRGARRSAVEEILAPLEARQREALGRLLSVLLDGPPSGRGDSPAGAAARPECAAELSRASTGPVTDGGGGEYRTV
jgi:DNA-binding MarR family transcriptional regulator